MDRHRLGADEQQGSDLAVAAPGADMGQNLALTWCQLVVGARCASSGPVDLGEQRFGAKSRGDVTRRSTHGARLLILTTRPQHRGKAYGRPRLLKRLTKGAEAFDGLAPQVEQVNLRRRIDASQPTQSGQLGGNTRLPRESLRSEGGIGRNGVGHVLLKLGGAANERSVLGLGQAWRGRGELPDDKPSQAQSGGEESAVPHPVERLDDVVVHLACGGQVSRFAVQIDE